MQGFLLLLIGSCFAVGFYCILAEVFHVTTYRTTKVILSVVKKNKKEAKNSDAILLEVAKKLERVIPMDEYRKRRLTAILRSAEIPMTAELYVAQAIVKAGFIFLGAIPCLFFMPTLAPVFLVIGIGVYFTESTKAEKMILARKQEIEQELPRFVATLTQELKASRDVLSILETYQKSAGKAFQNELGITIADMKTGNFEGALTRLEGRVGSSMLSDVVRGLIGVLRGDDGIAFFRMLEHDMKQLEIQRLKRLAMERPPKIRKYSFLLLGCMLLLYMGVMGYQIIGTMSGMF